MNDSSSSSQLELDDEVACPLKAEMAIVSVDQKAKLEGYEDRCEENTDWRKEKHHRPSSIIRLEKPSLKGRMTLLVRSWARIMFMKWRRYMLAVFNVFSGDRRTI